MASAYDRTPPRPFPGKLPGGCRPTRTGPNRRTGCLVPVHPDRLSAFRHSPDSRCGLRPEASVAEFPGADGLRRQVSLDTRPGVFPLVALHTTRKKTGPPLSTILLRHSFRCRPNICLEDAPSRSEAFRSLLWPQRHTHPAHPRHAAAAQRHTTFDKPSEPGRLSGPAPSGRCRLPCSRRPLRRHKPAGVKRRPVRSPALAGTRAGQGASYRHRAGTPPTESDR